MDHSPLFIRQPVMMTLSSFMMSTLYLVKRAVQSSSQSCAREMRVPVLRSSSTKAVWAAADRWGESGSWPTMVGSMGVPLAERTVGPVVREEG
jgi:hypothetical protein